MDPKRSLIPTTRLVLFRLWVWFYFPIVIDVGVGVWVVGLSFLVCFSPFGSLPLCSIGVLWLFLSPFWL